MRKYIIPTLFLLSLPFLALAHGGVDDGELIIRMTENGFEPKELTAVEGDEVLFINNDDVDRWPASNFHPSHTIYPEFDSLTGIKPGESWKMKFEKAGTWRMHDHLIPHMTGTIVVLEDLSKTTTTPEVATATKLEESIGLWAKIKAFFSKLFATSPKKVGAVDEKALLEFKSLDERSKYAWLEERAGTESPEAAWNYVLAAYNTPEGVVGNPHDLAHLVGQLIFKKNGFEGLSICKPVFAFGCYHGLMEVAFDKDDLSGYRDQFIAAEKGCAAIGSTSSPSYWSCIHGIGHGAITFREHALDKALTDCDILGDSVKTYCHDGVFMELSISAPPNFYRKDTPLYPCNTVAESYKKSCARSQVQVMKQRFGFKSNDIASACLKSGSDTIIHHCIDAIGYAVGQESGGAAEEVVTGCKTIVDEKSSAQCLAAAAGELVFQNTAGWQESVKKICESATGSYREACEVRVGQVKQSYGR